MSSSNLTYAYPHRFFMQLFIYILAILFAGQMTVADQSNQEPSESSYAQRKSSSSYCGIYCLYAVMKLSGQEVDFRELVKPEYIGSRRGSSLAELKKAAGDHRLYAVPVGKLTSRVLQNCPYAIILHVKSESTSKKYDHYELFLGAENGKAKIFNPPEPIKLVPFRELAPRWDGNGLIVSTGTINLSTIFAPVRKRFVIYAAITIAAILLLHCVKQWLPRELLNSRRKLFGLSIVQGAAFAIAALLCGMVYHFANDEGFLANAHAISSIQQAHLGNFIPKISENKVRKLLNTDTVFIDARFARDFEAGHLEGAINVPIDANDVEHQTITANISKDARIVLYCQSAGCKFAEKVAINLMADGFSNVSIFKGGWQEWIAKNGKPKENQL